MILAKRSAGPERRFQGGICSKIANEVVRKIKVGDLCETFSQDDVCRSNPPFAFHDCGTILSLSDYTRYIDASPKSATCCPQCRKSIQGKLFSLDDVLARSESSGLKPAVLRRLGVKENDFPSRIEDVWQAAINRQRLQVTLKRHRALLERLPTEGWSGLVAISQFHMLTKQVWKTMLAALLKKASNHHMTLSDIINGVQHDISAYLKKQEGSIHKWKCLRKIIEDIYSVLLTQEKVGDLVKYVREKNIVLLGKTLRDLYRDYQYHVATEGKPLKCQRDKRLSARVRRLSHH